MSMITPVHGPGGSSGGFSGYLKQALRRPARARRDGEGDFGFALDDVAEIHLDKEGADRHLWVRLKDGRIFDAPGFYGVQGGNDGQGGNGISA